MTRTTRRDLVKLGGGATALAALGAPVTGTAGAKTARHHAHSLPVGYPMGPFVRDPGNPILRPGTQPWESKFVFNPAAIVKDGLVQLLYRAQGPDGRSSIGLATSSDGVRFRRRREPVLIATEPYELPGGCEDPRVVRVRGTYYMTYTGYDGTSARLCLATSREPRDVDEARAAVPGLPDPRRRQAVEQVRGDPHDADRRPLLHVLRRQGHLLRDVQRPHPLDAGAGGPARSCARSRARTPSGCSSRARRR